MNNKPSKLNYKIKPSSNELPQIEQTAQKEPADYDEPIEDSTTEDTINTSKNDYPDMP